MARRLLCLMGFVLVVGVVGTVSAVELGDYYVIEDFESYNSIEELRSKG